MRSGLVCPFDASAFDILLSFTQATQYRNCAASWSLSHLTDEKAVLDEELEVEADEDESKIATVGSALKRGRIGHDIAAKYIRHCRTTKHESDHDALTEIFADVVTAAHPDAQTLDDLTEFIHEFGSSYSFPDDGSQWFVEEPIWFILKSGGVRVAVVAILDYLRVLGVKAEVDDLKTTARLPSREQFNRSMQLPIYALAVMHKFPDIEEIHTRNVYPACHGEMGLTVTPAMLHRAKQFLLETGEMILAGKRRVAAGERVEDVFEAQPGEACTPYTGVICPVINRCPYVARSEEIVVTTQAEAELLAADILQLQATVAAKLRIAKRAASAGLKLQAGGMLGQFTTRKTWATDKTKALALIRELTSEPDQYLDVDRNALDKAGLLDDLMATGAIGYSVTAGAFKFSKTTGGKK